MKSRAVVGKHPIHPMLIPFPIAFLTGSVAFDIASRALSSEPLYTTATHCMIAGVIMGVVAAVPGLVDFTSINPENSGAKNKATYHIIVNTIALTAFLVAFLARPPFVARNVITIVPAYLGFVFLSVGGWLGGSLVYEEKVGIEEEVPQQAESMSAPWEAQQPDIGAYPHH